MKAVAGAVAVVLSAVLLFAYVFGIRPFHASAPGVSIQPAARDYWISVRGDAGLRQAALRHKWGGSWPIPSFVEKIPYKGDAGTLNLEYLPGLDRRLMVLRYSLWATGQRHIVWEVGAFGNLRLVADGLSIGDVPQMTFEDADGDGREEVAERSRRYPVEGEPQSHRLIRTTYHDWTGDRFKPRWKQLEALGTRGPLVDLADPGEPGLNMDPAR